MLSWQAPQWVKKLAGVDEVGRGPLAGDVVVAAVILPLDHDVMGLDDSKRLSSKRREDLYEQIISAAVSYSVARSTVAEIDHVNILQATLNAMVRAVQGLSVQPDYIAVDGNRLPKWTYPAEAVVGGDGHVEVISAASIIAKVVRDREMVQFAEQYPGYGFAAHKGYPTGAHLKALQTLGPSPIHRQSFAPVRAAALADKQRNECLALFQKRSGHD